LFFFSSLIPRFSSSEKQRKEKTKKRKNKEKTRFGSVGVLAPPPLMPPHPLQGTVTQI
jgi:hypothetical protein